MIDAPLCPTCNGYYWTELGSRVYRYIDSTNAHSSDAIRLRVLFEIWLPGVAEFSAHSLLCRECGLVIYAPRPSIADLDAKYRFLVDSGPDSVIPALSSEYNRQRVRQLTAILDAEFGQRPIRRILDFGGGDGRLMERFLERGGSQCFVVDYTNVTLPGVTKLGNTLSDVGITEPFDAVICSHVLEHVDNPWRICVSLRELMPADGILYVEVPMEIWRRPPLLTEPVTHVNFFTHSSLRYVLVRAGFNVKYCRTEGQKLPGFRGCVVRAIARPTGTPQALPTDGFQLVQRLLSPGLYTKLWWALRHPGVLPRSLWNRLRFKRAKLGTN